MDEYMKKLGRKLEIARLNKGLSRRSLATELGFKTDLSIYNIERAKTKLVDLVLLNKWCEVCGVSLRDLL